MKSYIIIHHDLPKKSKNQQLAFWGTLITILLFISNFNVNAQTGNCPQLVYEYDESGNRIKREYKIESCSTYNNPNLRIASSDSIQANFSSLKVYPNPVFDNLTIESLSDQNINEVFIYDANSKEIFKSNYNEKRIIVPLQFHKPGIYFVNISQDKLISTYKIVKK